MKLVISVRVKSPRERQRLVQRLRECGDSPRVNREVVSTTRQGNMLAYVQAAGIITESEVARFEEEW